jgi:hypothetical protein
MVQGALFVLCGGRRPGQLLQKYGVGWFSLYGDRCAICAKLHICPLHTQLPTHSPNQLDTSCTLPRSLPADFSRIAVVIPVLSNCHERSTRRVAFPLQEQKSRRGSANPAKGVGSRLGNETRSNQIPPSTSRILAPCPTRPTQLGEELARSWR